MYRFLTNPKESALTVIGGELEERYPDNFTSLYPEALPHATILGKNAIADAFGLDVNRNHQAIKAIDNTVYESMPETASTQAVGTCNSIDIVNGQLFLWLDSPVIDNEISLARKALEDLLGQKITSDIGAHMTLGRVRPGTYPWKRKAMVSYAADQLAQYLPKARHRRLHFQPVTTKLP